MEKKPGPIDWNRAFAFCAVHCCAREKLTHFFSYCVICIVAAICWYTPDFSF